jgi:hypothetical protein
MRESLKLATWAAAALLMAIAPEANAGEFCRRDVTGHMTSCVFDSMAQCQASSAGLGGDCFHDPFLNDSRNSYAYHPKSSRSRNGSPSTGNGSNTDQ